MRLQAPVQLERRLLRALASLPEGLARRLAGRAIVVDGVPLDAYVQLGLRGARRRPPLEEQAVDAARASYAALIAALEGPTTSSPLIIDRSIDVGARRLPTRWYHASPPTEGPPPRPAIIYFHGGGHVIGDLDTHDPICRFFARRSGVDVISVAYRLAPEAPFPAGVDDALAVFRHLRERGAALGVDPTRLGVAGDSAGGNLAAVTALAARADGRGGPACQILLYPSLCVPREAMPSYRHFAEGFGLDATTIVWFRDHYLPRRADLRDWRVSPLFAPDVEGLPPTWIATAGFDALRDEGAAYADRLQGAGVDVTYACRGDLIHGFAHMLDLVPSARVAMEQAADAARAWLIAPS